MRTVRRTDDDNSCENYDDYAVDGDTGDDYYYDYDYCDNWNDRDTVNNINVLLYTSTVIHFNYVLHLIV